MEPKIKYLGLTPGAEILGGTQANFAVALPNRSAKELAVLLNDPAAAYAAEQTNRENTPEFRAEAAEKIGIALVMRDLSRGRLDSVTLISKEMLVLEPQLLDLLKGTPAAAV